MSVDWGFVSGSCFLVFFVFILDAIFCFAIDNEARNRILRKLDWFVYERPVIRRLEREKRDEEEKKRVTCTHVGPYR